MIAFRPESAEAGTVVLVSGFRSIDEFFTAEENFRTQIGPLLDSAEGAAKGNFRSILETRSQINNLLGNLPDASAAGIAKLRGEEKQRLIRDINRESDEARQDVLEVANFANFNPGRPVGDIEEFRLRSVQDADQGAEVL